MLGTVLLLSFLGFLSIVFSALALASRADDAMERRNKAFRANNNTPGEG